MAHHRTDVILKKLYYIHTVCSDAKKKNADEGEKKDSFKQQKDKIASQIKEAKQVRQNQALPTDPAPFVLTPLALPSW